MYSVIRILSVHDGTPNADVRLVVYLLELKCDGHSAERTCHVEQWISAYFPSSPFLFCFLSELLDSFQTSSVMLYFSKLVYWFSVSAHLKKKKRHIKHD